MKKILLALLLLSGTAFASGGTLQISSQSAMPHVVPREGINIPLLNLSFTAKDEDITIEKLIFQRTGLSDSQDIKSIRAIGTNVYSRSFPILTNDTGTITFFGKWTIPAETSETITITANLDVQGTGRTIGLNLVEIVSSATTSSLEEETTSSPTTNQSSSFPTETSSFKERNVDIEKIPFSVSRLRLGHWQKLGRFRLTNEDEKAVNLDSIYIKNKGVGSFPDIFQNVILTSRNKIISKMGTFSDKTARFSFLPNTNIDGSSSLLLEAWGQIRRNKSTYSVNFEAENEDIITR